MARRTAGPAAVHRAHALSAYRPVVKKRILALLVAAGLAPGTFVRTAIPAPDFDSPLSARLLDVETQSAGPLTLVRAWHLQSPNDHFGGYSALLARGDGTLLAGSDAGRLLSMTLRSGKLDGEFEAFPGATGADKRDVDLEALTQDIAGAQLWAAYEVSNSIVRHRGLADEGTRVAPPAMSGWLGNSGPEAMVRLADGRFIVLAEQKSRFGGDSHEGLLFPTDPVEGAEPLVFRLATPDSMRPVDMAAMPDGRVLILLRSLSLFPPGFHAALAVADPQEIAEGANWPLEVVAQIDRPLPPENYEGLALREAADGGCSVWLISDDNFSRFQRTLLLQFAWPECAKGAPRDAARPSGD